MTSGVFLCADIKLNWLSPIDRHQLPRFGIPHTLPIASFRLTTNLFGCCWLLASKTGLNVNPVHPVDQCYNFVGKRGQLRRRNCETKKSLNSSLPEPNVGTNRDEKQANAL